MWTTAQGVAAATNQLKIARTGGLQRVKANLRMIEMDHGVPAITVLAEVWAQNIVITKGQRSITDPVADPAIVEAANEFIRLLVADEEDAARALIAGHAEPMYVASVLLMAAI